MLTFSRWLQLSATSVILILAGLTLMSPEVEANSCSCAANDQSDKTYDGDRPKRSLVKAGLMVAKINCTYSCQVGSGAPVTMRGKHTVHYYKSFETQTTLTCLGYKAIKCHTNPNNLGQPICSLVPGSFNPRRSKSKELKDWAIKNGCNYF